MTEDEVTALENVIAVCVGIPLVAALLIIGLVDRSENSDANVTNANETMGQKTSSGVRTVIAASRIVGRRCSVKAFANGVAVTFEIDTGDPYFADFNIGWANRIGLDPENLNYREWWPGTRYGRIATTTLHSLRIGSWELRNIPVNVYDNWGYTYGDESYPLLGLSALQRDGIRLEVEGNVCRLTV